MAAIPTHANATVMLFPTNARLIFLTDELQMKGIWLILEQL
jgi:hypothetical protein